MGLIVASATSAGGWRHWPWSCLKRKSRDTKSLPTQVKVARQAKTAESGWQESQAIQQTGKCWCALSGGLRGAV